MTIDEFLTIRASNRILVEKYSGRLESELLDAFVSTFDGAYKIGDTVVLLDGGTEFVITHISPYNYSKNFPEICYGGKHPRVGCSISALHSGCKLKNSLTEVVRTNYKEGAT